MRKILFDLYEAQPALTSKFHGGGEYIKAVFRQLINRYFNQMEIAVFYDETKFLDQWILEELKQKNIKTYSVRKEEDIAGILKQENFDVFYSGLPYYYKREWIPEKVKVVGTIHGLRFVEMPGDQYACLYGGFRANLKEWIRYRVRKLYQKKKIEEFRGCIDLLDEIVCVSSHTHFSVLNHFPQARDKNIRVFYTPQKVAKFCESDTPLVEGKYILIMGGDRWIKNCYREILAFENLFDNGELEEYKIVIVGGASDGIKRKMKHSDRYIIRNYVENDELENLYCFCELFVYASLNEGFGMPPLEVMKYGRTCIVSGVCSLPEICGPAAYYVNPYDVGEIAGRVLQALNEKKPEEAVRMQFEKIQKRQCEDLDKVCRSIIG